MKLWDKGYKPNKKIADFVVGNDYLLDMTLVKYDCIASIAHARMLNKIGIITKIEASKLVNELNNIIKLNEQGKFLIKKEQEDCHTAIENMLTERLGNLGKKIHTGRSRNDQVLVALRLYYKENLKECIKLSNSFISSVKNFRSRYGDIKLPGYTHMRKAMPSSINMWAAAFIDSMGDNIKLLQSAYELADQSPLGTGAGYGIPLNLDSKYTAKILGFGKVQGNPIYAQMSRGKFESTILHALTQIMFDFNKLASDLIIFTMPEFGYFGFPKEFYMGSSIMPQKKNPDVLELLRARYHLILSYEMLVKNVSSNLISGYNSDIQLTKEPVMKGFELTQKSLSIASLIFDNLKVDKERCKKGLTEEVYATQNAYKLVKEGVPFRDAYKKIAKKYK